MKIIDILFGKRIQNDYYHVNTDYFSRISVDDNISMDETISNSITDIQSKCDLSDDINSILIDTKSNLENKEYSKADVNLCEISYLGYELYVIIRTDITNNVNPEYENRSYCINLNKSYNGITHIAEGACNIYEDIESMSTPSIVMDFISDGKLNVINHEDLLEMEGTINDYVTLSEMNEGYKYDATKVIKYYESLGFKFIAFLNTSLTE